MSYGLTDTGFVKKTIDVIIQEIGDDIHDDIGATLDLSPTGPLGQLIAVLGDKIRELWDVGEGAYRAHFPNSAEGASLDDSLSITGNVRLKAQPSTVTLNLFLDNGVTVAAGKIVSVGVSGNRFVTLASVSNTSGVAATFQVEAESEDTGPIAGYSKTIDTIQTPVFGWSAACAITCDNAENYALDGTSLTLKVDRGSEQTVNFSSGNPWSASSVATRINNQTTGVNAYAVGTKVRVASTTNGTGSAIEITGGTANAVLGFDTDEIKGFNPLDADLGRNIETDPDFRLRATSLLRGQGKATLEAILAAVKGVEDVTQAIAYENVEELPDDLGLPPKSFEIIVLGGDDQEVVDTIWDTKGAGIKSHGKTFTVIDSQGFSQFVSFSRPFPVLIYISCIVDVDPILYPADGDDLVKQAIVDLGDTQGIGETVIALQYKSAPLSVPGVKDVTVFLIDKVNPPIGTVNIELTYRELADFDTSRITVTS